MKKVKIVDSGFDKETGISYVTIQNSKGQYTGYSTLQEDDRKYISQMAGCRYAEIKAHIKMIEAEIKELKVQLHAFERFYNNASKSWRFNKNGYEARKMRREMHGFKDKITELEELKTSMHNTLMTAIDNRQKEIEQFHKGVEIMRKRRENQNKND